MLKVLRHLLFVFVSFAIIGGTTMELARSAQYTAPMTMTGMPCDMAMHMSASGDMKPMAPCKHMPPDCMKLMGGVTAIALPARFQTHEMAVRYSTVDYWTVSPKLASLDHEPEPIPPRTA